MDETRPCQLYILSDTGTILVARGTVYETTTVVHGVQLSEDEFKVTVDEVIIADVVLPVLQMSSSLWKKHLSPLLPGLNIWLLIGQEGSPTPKKTHLFEDDPLGALDELAKIISDAPMNVHWDSTTFGREAQIPLYLHHQDVRELASGREEINITFIQLWMISLATHMMLSGRSTATAKKVAWVALKVREEECEVECGLFLVSFLRIQGGKEIHIPQMIVVGGEVG
ncbi:hypothetical protein LR48_Vigan45s002700 [Vigna angularis]|uniref:DUF8039 domain-containing protein n=1 Tax=Phaseolus angularis TaxID=3914 RepID=A0A0L9T358_PHAAN|nr:hypothetical protein LR48_Vigan45s002700 [Vigna angularis]